MCPCSPAPGMAISEQNLSLRVPEPRHLPLPQVPYPHLGCRLAGCLRRSLQCPERGEVTVQPHLSPNPPTPELLKCLWADLPRRAGMTYVLSGETDILQLPTGLTSGCAGLPGTDVRIFLSFILTTHLSARIALRAPGENVPFCRLLSISACQPFSVPHPE